MSSHDQGALAEVIEQTMERVMRWDRLDMKPSHGDLQALVDVLIGLREALHPDPAARPPDPGALREIPTQCEHWHTDGTFCRPCVMRLLRAAALHPSAPRCSVTAWHPPHDNCPGVVEVPKALREALHPSASAPATASPSCATGQHTGTVGGQCACGAISFSEIAVQYPAPRASPQGAPTGVESREALAKLLAETYSRVMAEQTEHSDDPLDPMEWEYISRFSADKAAWLAVVDGLPEVRRGPQHCPGCAGAVG